MKKNNEKGLVLVTLLIFTAIAVVIIGAATLITIINTQSVSVVSNGNYSYKLAESGIENAVLRLLRTPDTYTGETMLIGENSVVITVSGTDIKTITSQASFSGNIKKIQVTADTQDNKVIILTWKDLQ